ncbi:MAG: hypothetical protein HZB53_12090 [Chloroflexi bacterium]|nr:hypothetical protein [Chloroflexota bacterium]
MNFGQYLSRAWALTWKYKVLWIFGILAALGGGRSANFNFNFGGGGRSGTVPPIVTPFPPGGNIPPLVTPFPRGGIPTPTPPLTPPTALIPPEATPILIVAACVAIIIAIMLFVLSIIGTGGLIGGLRLAEEQGAVTFGEAWSIGTQNFMRLFGLKLLLLLPVFLFACIILTGTAFTALTAGLGIFCLIPLICVGIIAFIPIGIIAHFAQFAVVLESMGPIDAFKRGWAILKANLVNILILGVIVLIITGVIGFVLALPFLIIALPVILSTIGNQGMPDTGPLAFAVLCCACYLPVLIVLSGIMETWSTGVWTLAYPDLAGNTLAPSMPPTPPPAPPAPLAPLPPIADGPSSPPAMPS